MSPYGEGQLSNDYQSLSSNLGAPNLGPFRWDNKCGQTVHHILGQWNCQVVLYYCLWLYYHYYVYLLFTKFSFCVQNSVACYKATAYLIQILLPILLFYVNCEFYLKLLNLPLIWCVYKPMMRQGSWSCLYLTWCIACFWFCKDLLMA